MSITSKNMMYVVKRDGRSEKVHFDKITSRIKKLCYGLNDAFVDPVVVSQKVCQGVYRGVTTSELDELAAETAAHLTAEHPDYGLLAARICVSNLHKNTGKNFVETMKRLHAHRDKTNQPAPLIDASVLAFIERNAPTLNGAIIYDRDYSYDYFGFKTLERSYLMRLDGKVIERPQHMLMRVAAGIHYYVPKKQQQRLLQLEQKQQEAKNRLLLAKQDDNASDSTSCDGSKDSKANNDGGAACKKNSSSSSSVREAEESEEDEEDKRANDAALEATLETYNYMSQGWFTHASPTLFNAGTPRPALSSCFLLQIQSDSIEGIYDTLKQTAMISKSAGGIGLAVHTVRATGSYIRGTNGTSNGLVPMLRVFNNTARYVDQGGGKRKGAFAVYLEPWHADIDYFLNLRKNTGTDEQRTRDLFLGLWVPDLFMRRALADQHWTLFCPNEAPGLPELWGPKFDALYIRYEQEGRGRKTMRARVLLDAIIAAQVETGVPYMLYKDACNNKSNQKNLGTIKCSNLCVEIVEFTSPDEVAVCNLASIALPMFVREVSESASSSEASASASVATSVSASASASASYSSSSASGSAGPFLEPGSHVGRLNQRRVAFDFKKLYDVVQIVTRNLNRVIDINYYPVVEARRSNMRHRPIGIGVQGLADTFVKMRMPFDGPEAARLNRDIFETMYFAALAASKDLAKRHGPYASYQGSPVSQGILQFDMWDKKPPLSGMWDWNGLRKEIAANGVRNSLLIAPMPTASTSQILGNCEGIEAPTSNLYVRRTLAGEFVCVSRHLLADLVELGLWTPQLKNKLIAHGGSVQNLSEVPSHIKALYKTVWELSQKVIINMAAERGVYVDQSQSMNIHIANATVDKMRAMHFYAWEKGLKSGMYYLRTRPAADAIKFTVDQKMLREESAEATSPSAALLGSTVKEAPNNADSASSSSPVPPLSITTPTTIASVGTAATVVTRESDAAAAVQNKQQQQQQLQRIGKQIEIVETDDAGRVEPDDEHDSGMPVMTHDEALAMLIATTAEKTPLQPLAETRSPCKLAVTPIANRSRVAATSSPAFAVRPVTSKSAAIAISPSSSATGAAASSPARKMRGSTESSQQVDHANNNSDDLDKNGAINDTDGDVDTNAPKLSSSPPPVFSVDLAGMSKSASAVALSTAESSNEDGDDDATNNGQGNGSNESESIDDVINAWRSEREKKKRELQELEENGNVCTNCSA